MIQDGIEALSERREPVFDARWRFGIAPLFNDAETYEFSQSLVQHFCRQPVHRVFHGSGAANPLADQAQDRERPFATDDILQHPLHGLGRRCFGSRLSMVFTPWSHEDAPKS
jgi:hypothetical protein